MDNTFNGRPRELFAVLLYKGYSKINLRFAGKHKVVVIRTQDSHIGPTCKTVNYFVCLYSSSNQQKMESVSVFSNSCKERGEIC